MAKAPVKAGKAASKPAAKAGKKKSFKKKEKRVVHSGVVHIQATFNNTIVTISDQEGNTISWSSAGVRPRFGPRLGGSRVEHRRYRSSRHQGCDAHPAQRVPSSQKAQSVRRVGKPLAHARGSDRSRDRGTLWVGSGIKSGSKRDEGLPWP